MLLNFNEVECWSMKINICRYFYVRFEDVKFKII